MSYVRSVGHNFLKDECGDRYERFGHTKTCDQIESVVVEVLATCAAQVAAATNINEALARITALISTDDE